ncbi:MAG: hypothetical protein H6698_01885 [Myxococcales bacterium]|nr:hypothetical protein [Myxococcales bacterium]MCB9533061.1 hypothetical protein [Myxococcales bacterium]
MPDDSAQSGAEPPRYEQSGSSVIFVLGGALLFSTVLGVLFGYRYVEVMRYVRDTLDVPTTPLAWDARPLSPDECVEQALTWASECHGIKSMCDAYVDRVIAMCLESQPRDAYCASVHDTAATTRFGYRECALRGVRRNLDAEACAQAYRAVASYCATFAATNPDGSGEAPR